MFSLIHGFYQHVFAKTELHILILGLDNAGKTTLLEQMKGIFKKTPGIPPDRIPPTIGLNRTCKLPHAALFLAAFVNPPAPGVVLRLSAVTRSLPAPRACGPLQSGKWMSTIAGSSSGTSAARCVVNGRAVPDPACCVVSLRECSITQLKLYATVHPSHTGANEINMGEVLCGGAWVGVCDRLGRRGAHGRSAARPR